MDLEEKFIMIDRLARTIKKLKTEYRILLNIEKALDRFGGKVGHCYMELEIGNQLYKIDIKIDESILNDILTTNIGITKRTIKDVELNAIAIMKSETTNQ